MGIFNKHILYSKSSINSSAPGPPGIGFKLLNGNYDIQNKRLVNVAEAIDNNDVIIKHVLETSLLIKANIQDAYMKKNQIQLTSHLDANSLRIVDLQPPKNDTDALNLNYGKTIFLTKNSIGNYDAHYKKIVNIGDPITSQHCTNKSYVDRKIKLLKSYSEGLITSINKFYRTSNTNNFNINITNLKKDDSGNDIIKQTNIIDIDVDLTFLYPTFFVTSAKVSNSSNNIIFYHENVFRKDENCFFLIQIYGKIKNSNLRINYTHSSKNSVPITHYVIKKNDLYIITGKFDTLTPNKYSNIDIDNIIFDDNSDVYITIDTKFTPKNINILNDHYYDITNFGKLYINVIDRLKIMIKNMPELFNLIGAEFEKLKVDVNTKINNLTIKSSNMNTEIDNLKPKYNIFSYLIESARYITDESGYRQTNFQIIDKDLGIFQYNKRKMNFNLKRNTVGGKHIYNCQLSFDLINKVPNGIYTLVVDFFYPSGFPSANVTIIKNDVTTISQMTTSHSNFKRLVLIINKNKNLLSNGSIPRIYILFAGSSPNSDMHVNANAIIFGVKGNIEPKRSTYYDLKNYTENINDATISTLKYDISKIKQFLKIKYNDFI